jgi:hypothetical protein
MNKGRLKRLGGLNGPYSSINSSSFSWKTDDVSFFTFKLSFFVSFGGNSVLSGASGTSGTGRGKNKGGKGDK